MFEKETYDVIRYLYHRIDSMNDMIVKVKLIETNVPIWKALRVIRRFGMMEKKHKWWVSFKPHPEGLKIVERFKNFY